MQSKYRILILFYQVERCLRVALSLHNSGPCDNVNNYRSISVLPALSKILKKEHVHFSSINYVNEYNILILSQSGLKSAHLVRRHLLTRLTGGSTLWTKNKSKAHNSITKRSKLNDETLSLLYKDATLQMISLHKMFVA